MEDKENNFYMPFLMDVELASRKIAKGLEANRGRIIFPIIFYAIIRILLALPFFRNSILGSAYLIDDFESLQLIAQHVSELSLNDQYEHFFECWYRTVLLTRKISELNNTDEQKKKIDFLNKFKYKQIFRTLVKFNSMV
mgnify:CR=1 FL=1